jgi:outer membrane protein assembly factor BamB
MSALAAESRVDVPTRRAMPERELEEQEEEAPPAPADKAGAPVPAEETAREGESLKDRLRKAMDHQPHRPGEEDTIRSPLVLTLLGAVAVLALLAATFYFIAGRQTTQQEYDLAAQLIAEQKYAQAIIEFDDFIALHPKDPLAQQAKVQRNLARIDQQIDSAVPNWAPGLETLREFLSAHRDDENFKDLQEEVRRRAGTIALGAARAAGKTFDRELLEVSKQANTIYSTYQTKDGATAESDTDVAKAQRQSEAAILRNETFLGGVAKIDEALKARQPMQALQLRRDLLVRYPDFAEDRNKAAKLAAKLEEALQLERSLVQSEELDRPGVTEERATEVPPPLAIVFHKRSRTDEVSLGQAVCALSKDCCYGIDTVTSDPVWRRVVGLNSPFFPIREPSTPSVILFDTVHQELVRVHQNTGALLWRQPIGEAAFGQPLIDEGQIYLPTLGGRLYKIDLASGAVSTRLTFSQAITGPVALADGQHLAVAGDQEVVYTLTKRPLACEGVSFLSQKARSIEAPLLAMGPYLLMIENGDADRSRLRLLSAADPLHLREVAAEDVAGLVLDTPVIRGRDLFVPSVPERVSAFTVSDDPGQPPLLKGPVFQAEGKRESPIFLSTGPDRQLWMASSALRKLQLTTSALEADQQVIAVGLSSQPLQYLGGVMFNGRRRAYTDAVTFTQTNREEMTSAWQAVLGARMIAWSVSDASPPTLVCVTEAGHPFRITDVQLQSTGFYVEGSVKVNPLPLNDDLDRPLLAAALGDGQVAVAAGDPEPKIWVINKNGQTDRSFTPSAPLQAAPAPLGSRLVFPVAGKLQVSSTAGQPPIQELALPSDQAETVVWRQVLAVDDNNVIAVTEQGQVIQVRLQTSPRAHLAEITRMDLGAALDLAGDLADGVLVLADASGRVRAFDAANLDVRAERTLASPVTSDLWLVGGRLFAEVGGTQCECLDPQDSLKSRWPQPLELHGVGLAGRPLIAEERVLLTQVDGTVSVVDLATGQTKAQLRVESALTSGPIRVGGEVFAATLDGSLVKITQLTQDN